LKQRMCSKYFFLKSHFDIDEQNDLEWTGELVRYYDSCDVNIQVEPDNSDVIGYLLWCHSASRTAQLGRDWISVMVPLGK